MAYIKRLADNKYFVRVSKGTGDTRKQHSRIIRGTLKDAKKWARDNETKLDLDIPIGNQTLTFAEYFNKWQKRLPSKYPPNTVDDYIWNIETYFLKQLGKISLINLKRADIQTIADKLAEKGFKRNSISKVLTVVSSMLTSAVKEEIIKVSPCKLIELPRADKEEIIVLDEFEVPLFVSACQSHSFGLLFEFALETGMRPSEILALNWNDIDFSSSLVKISKSVHYRDAKTFYFKEPKVQSSNRQIEISEALLTKLKILQNTQTVRQRKMDLVFPNSAGLPTNRKLLYRPLKDILKNAGISKNITPYSLRHTCATLLLLEGENPQAVASRLGDKSALTILDNYAHFLPTMQKRATDKLSKIMRG